MINLTVVIDNDEAIRKLRELQNVAKTTTSSVVKDSERMDASWQQMKNTLMSLTAGVSFAALAKQVVQIRGEVQQLEVAFETMLGSKEKADTLMSEIIDLAAKTPFGLQDVSNATKMLLAYGSTAEEVTGEIKMLGNIASGLSIPLNDLIYLYGTTRTQGRMFTMDLRQFMGRGIPLAEELAKQFGVTKDKVGELVTAGKVGFDDMAKALQAMSSEGGKFNNLMDKQSATISGQISNLEDAIYQMFNEIGRSSEGVISDLISGASWVVEHYQEILNVLKYVIAAYGSYKAALILVAAAQKAMALWETTSAILAQTQALRRSTQAMILFNTAVKANPLGLLLSILSTVAMAIWDFSDGTEEATKHMGALEKAARDEYIEVNRLVGRLQDANISENERNSILNKLKTVAPSIVDGLKDEANMTAQLTANLKDYNAEQVKRIQLAALDDKAEEEMKKVGDAKIDFGEKQVALSNLIADYQSMRAAGVSPDINVSGRYKSGGRYIALRDWNEQNVKEVKKLTDKLDAILLDDKTTDAFKTLEIEKLFSGDIKLESINGLDINGAISALNQSRDNVQQAESAFDAFVKEDKQLREVIGLVADNTKNDAENVKSYAQAFTDAQEAYLSTQKELAKANADRAAGKSTISEKEYLDIVDRAELAAKEYKKLGGVVNTQEQAQKELSEREKKAKEAAKLAQELQNDVVQAEIDAMTEGTDKKIAQIKHDYNLRKQEIQRQQVEFIAAQGTALTLEQTDEFDTLIKDAASKRDKAISATYESELAEMYGFLKEYGTFQQRKLALTEEYEQKIAKATSKTEKLRLEKERDTGLAAISAENLEQSINWELIFGDFGNMFFEIIRPEYEKLREYLETDEFKNADAEDKETLISAYERLSSIFGDTGEASFKSLGQSIQALQVANSNLKSKQDAYAAAFERLTSAQETYKKALVEGNDAQIAVSKAYLEFAEMMENAASEEVAEATNNKKDAEDDATKKTMALAKAFDETQESLKGLSGASISTILPNIWSLGDALQKFGGTVGNVGQKLSSALGGSGSKIGGIAALVLTILEILKDGISGLVVPIIDTIFNAISGIIGDILNFKEGLFRKLGESLYKGIMGIVENILTLGGWFDWINFDSDRTLDKDIQRLSSVNEALINSIDRLDATLDEQIGITQRVLDNNLEMMKRSAQASSNGFWGVGGTKSSATKVSKGISDSEWEQVSDLLGKEVNSGWEFFNLDAEELYKVASKLPEIWGKIIDLADDGYKDAAQYMEAVVDNVAELRDLEKEEKEKFTGISYDEFRNKFKSALLDMEMSAEDFADDFEQMLVNSIVDAMMTEHFDEAIEALYNKWADFMKDGELTDAERAELEADRDNIYKDIEDRRQFIKDMGLSNPSGQSTTSKGFQAMSQDTGDELNGRFTDIQGKVTGIHEAVQFMKSLSSQQLSQTSSINATVAMIHNDTQLIEKHTRALANISEDINAMRQIMANGGY